MELFYDPAFTFAISQLSSHLLWHVTWRRAAETLLLLCAVFTAVRCTPSTEATWFDITRRHARRSCSRW